MERGDAERRYRGWRSRIIMRAMHRFPAYSWQRLLPFPRPPFLPGSGSAKLARGGPHTPRYDARKTYKREHKATKRDTGSSPGSEGREVAARKARDSDKKSKRRRTMALERERGKKGSRETKKREIRKASERRRYEFLAVIRSPKVSISLRLCFFFFSTTRVAPCSFAPAVGRYIRLELNQPLLESR